MATTYKVLGQSNPAATTMTTLYTVPSGTQAVASTISIANINGIAQTFRIAVRPGGAALDPKHYLDYDISVAASTSIKETIGITLAATDVVSVYASSTGLAFSLFGSEIA